MASFHDRPRWLTEATASGVTSGLGTSSVVIEVDTEGLTAGAFLLCSRVPSESTILGVGTRK